MRKFLLTISFALLFFLPAERASASRPVKNSPQPQATPAQLIAAINEYRAANGLPPYQQNSILMSTAQGQADYQASITTVTHTGPGGTRPIDRAYAAGYGGGDKVFVSEIIYGGGTATVNTAVNWWKGSQIHNDTMLASTYQEIGAGVASNGTYMYFTAVTGWVANGVTPPVDSGGSLAGSAGASSDPSSSVPIAVPVVVATPQEDGSIMHVIRTGQTLWTVAAVYEVPLEELLEINGLPENALIFPGDEVLVRQPTDETVGAPDEEGEQAPSATPTQPTRPTSTPRVTRTPAATAIAAANLDPLDASDQQQPAPTTPAATNSVVRWIVVIAFSSIFLVFISSFFMRREQSNGSPSKKEPPAGNQDPLTQDDILK